MLFLAEGACVKSGAELSLEPPVCICNTAVSSLMLPRAVVKVMNPASIVADLMYT